METLSIIIPTLNEAGHLEETLLALGDEAEIIVVDGGSEDSTIEMARNFGAKIYSSERGRAKQMNLGAKHASGDILLFLHADTIVPENYKNLIIQTLSRDDISACCFSLKFDSNSLLLKAVETSANVRTRLFSLPYGDQGLAITKSNFKILKGFKEISFLEDLEIVERINKTGSIHLHKESVLTSPRKYEKEGILNRVFKNQLVLFAYKLGAKPEKLNYFYSPKLRE